jgi:hypothetical protein
MRNCREREGDSKELISFLGDCIIDACKTSDEKDLLCLDDIREMVGISVHEWMGIKGQVEEYISEKHNIRVELWYESRGEKDGECVETLNAYIDGKTLSYYLKDVMDQDANGVTMELTR